MIVEGDNVAHMFDFVVSAPVEAKVRMCECFEVRDGKIHSSRLYFDPAKFPSP
jgi:limonene-1,2-epoxide hydrolase